MFLTVYSPNPYLNLGILTLARLTLEAEEQEDDIAFLTIQEAMESRPPAEQEAYRLAYIEEMRKRYGRVSR